MQDALSHCFLQQLMHCKKVHFAQTSILLFQKTDQNKPAISFRTACVNLEPEMAKNFFKLWKTL